MSNYDFNLMLAYDRLEPFGAMRDDLRMGIAVATYLNSQGGDAHFKPADFMPFLKTDEDEEPQQSIEEQIAVMEALTRHQEEYVRQRGGKK